MVILLALLLAMAGCTRRPAPPVNRALQLVTAVRDDSVAAVRNWLDEDVSPDTLAPDGTRPLTEAARHDRLDVAAVLLAAGARRDLADATGRRPFDYAMADGHRAMAAMLTRRAAQDAGANPATLAWFDALARREPPGDWHRVLDGELMSLGLVHAVLAGRDDAVTALRHAWGVPNRTGYSPLAVAARFGDSTAVATLLDASANPDVEVSGPLGETPLMEAARDGYVAVGRRLIRAGARIDHVDSHGETALMWAVRQGETAYAAMLLDAGADPMHAGRDGDTPRGLAHRINHEDLIAVLDRERRARIK